MKIPDGPKSSWEEQARELIARGYPAVEPLLPELVAWLKDLNWPGAIEIAEFLVSIGEPVVPHVRQALSSDDEIWIGWVLSEVVYYWPKELVVQIEPDLQRRVWYDLHSLYLLAKHGLGDLQSLKHVAAQTRSILERKLAKVSEIEACLSQFDR